MYDITSIIQAVTNAVHLKEVVTFYSDAEFKRNSCLCMFHEEETPSFGIYEKNGKELWHCFGCTTGGDAVSWVAKYFNLRQFEAAKKLNEDFRLGLKIGGRLTKADKEHIQRQTHQRKIKTAWQTWQKQHEYSEIDRYKQLKREKEQADEAGDWQKSAQLKGDIEFIDYQLDSIPDRTENDWQRIYLKENDIAEQQQLDDDNFFAVFAENEDIIEEKEASKSMDSKEVFTPELLKKWLDDNGISIRYNEISRRFDIKGLEEENQELLADNVVSIVHARLKQADLYKGCTLQAVNDYIAICGSRESFNPVLEYLNKYQWDGKSRLNELYNIMNLADNDVLSRILIKKWLMQCVSLLHNNFAEPFGADGCLTICGKQGIGKSSLFRQLAMKSVFFKEGLTIDTGDKDCVIRATSGWLAEIGELESTLRKDIEKLKAFLTAPTDEIRKPYGHSATISPRRTSYGATCNSTEFLIDTSGNRRFWVVPVTDINLNALGKLDIIQLWKEIQAIVQSEGLQSFRLTKEEQQALAERNSRHTRKIKAQMEIEDILSMTDEKHFSIVNEYQTITEFRDNFCSELGRFSLDVISKALEAVGKHSELKRIGDKVRRVRLLPKRIWR